MAEAIQENIKEQQEKFIEDFFKEHPNESIIEAFYLAYLEKIGMTSEEFDRYCEESDDESEIEIEIL